MPIQEAYNENDLLVAIAQGDERAFAAVFNHYRARIYTLALKLTGSSSVSEEIVQDVFLKLWMKRAVLTDIQNFPGFLVTVAQNTVYSAMRTLLRRKHKVIVSAESATALFHRDTEDQLSQKEITAIIEQAVQCLPPQQKQAYALIKRDGLTREQAAMQMQVRAETVKAHLAQALRHIRAYCLLRLDPPIILLLFMTLPA